METMTKTFTLNNGLEVEIRDAITLAESATIVETVTEKLFDKENYKIHLELFHPIFKYTVLLVYTNLDLTEDLGTFYEWTLTNDFAALWDNINKFQLFDMETAIKYNLEVYKSTLPNMIIADLANSTRAFMNELDTVLPTIIGKVADTITSALDMLENKEDSSNENVTQTETGEVVGE